MNLILENSEYVDYYTYLDKLFLDIPKFQELYWLISDIEYNFCSNSKLMADPILIDGISLNKILQKENIQFIWGVFSGFSEKPKSVPKNIPYANNNPDFWKGSPNPQANGAEIEIVCWDSTLTLFINTSEEIAEKLKTIYPDIKNLDEQNKLTL